MRISDWSSDVCSSDLAGKGGIESVEAAEMVDRAHFGQRADFIAAALQILLLGIAEHIVGKLVGRIELAAIDLRQQRQIELNIGPLCEELRIGQIIAQPRDRKSTRLNSSH